MVSAYLRSLAAAVPALYPGFFVRRSAGPASRQRGNALQQCQGIRRHGRIVVRTNERAGSRQPDRKDFHGADFGRLQRDHHDRRRRRTDADARPYRRALARDVIAGSPAEAMGDVGYNNLVAGDEATDTLTRGFTTVRDVGGPVFGLKRAIDEGIIEGPRIYPSGA